MNNKKCCVCGKPIELNSNLISHCEPCYLEFQEAYRDSLQKQMNKTDRNIFMKIDNLSIKESCLYCQYSSAEQYPFDELYCDLIYNTDLDYVMPDSKCDKFELDYKYKMIWSGKY
jgi:hypothetical protein